MEKPIIMASRNQLDVTRSAINKHPSNRGRVLFWRPNNAATKELT
jgi:hypothetical protein